MERFSKKTMLQLAVISLSLLVLVKGNEMSGSFEVCHLQCNNNNGGASTPPINSPSPTSRLLRGKSGPRGEKGVRGDAGVKGDAGVSCNLGEIAEIKNRISQLESGLDKLTNHPAVVHLLASDKWKFCGVGIQVDPNTGSSEVEDGQITASTFHTNHYAYHGRLLSKVGHGGWCALRNDGNQWIQVDLQSEKTLYGVVTQGIQHKDHWVTSFKVAYQRKNEGFRSIVDESGTALIFQGNNDRTSLVTNRFPQPINARYIRIQIVTYYAYSCLRFEVLTC